MYYLVLHFFVYGFLGWCTEVAFAACKEKKFVNRGFLNGPICPIYGIGVTVVLQFLSSYKNRVVLLYILSVILVTTLEWVTGFILEKLFHNKWWDYSNKPFNLNGYVCLGFSLIWGVGCVGIVKFVHPIIQKGLTFLPHWLGIVLILIFSIAMFADLYVTASTILKMNKRLEKMEEIAAELHRISDELGENIYHDMVQVMEYRDEWKEKMEDVSEDFKDKVQDMSEDLKEKMEDMSEDFKDKMQDMSGDLKDKVQDMSEDFKDKVQDMSEDLKDKVQDVSGDLKDKMQDYRRTSKNRVQDVSEEMSEKVVALKKRYRELGMKGTKTSKRLLKAFPRIQSKRYQEAMEDIKEYLKRK